MPDRRIADYGLPLVSAFDFASRALNSEDAELKDQLLKLTKLIAERA